MHESTSNRRIVTDITPPPGKRFVSRTPQPRDDIVSLARKRRSMLRYAAVLGTIALLAFAAIYGTGLVNLALHARESGALIADEFKTAARALQDLEPGKARSSLETVSREINSLETRSDKLGLSALLETGGKLFAELKAIPAILGRAGTLTERTLALAAELELLKSDGFGWLVARNGDLLLEHLRNVEGILERITELSGELGRGAPFAGASVSENLFPLRLDLFRAQTFLASFTRWLAGPMPRRFAFFFQNQSEMRPSGGFIGSYADLTILNGGLKELTVWDIYDPDGQLDARVVPPKPLQGITPRWGARDANWFFDFPMSAAKVLEFLNASKIYAERGVRFDGALALNINVIRSVLEVAGPIPLPEYNLTITPENFLPEIQREVEAGRDKAAGEPKRILKLLTPLLFERLGGLDEDAKQQLVQAFRGHFANRDIMLFFRDPELQAYIKSVGVAGDVLEPPKDFRGDYLAVVNANVGGGKTDAVVSQRIAVESVIGADGRVEDRLTVERRHAGDRETDPWYRATNRNYFKIFTPRGSRLTFLNGNDARDIVAPLDYAAAGYAPDDAVAAIEGSAKALPEFNAEQLAEAGKTVFAGWLNTNMGAAKILNAQYYTPVKLPVWDEAEIPYTFIFEKQSGARTSFALTIEAPPGYAWQGNPNGALFSYQNDDPPGRIELKLTLIPKTH